MRAPRVVLGQEILDKLSKSELAGGWLASKGSNKSSDYAARMGVDDWTARLHLNQFLKLGLGSQDWGQRIDRIPDQMIEARHLAVAESQQDILSGVQRDHKCLGFCPGHFVRLSCSFPKTDRQPAACHQSFAYVGFYLQQQPPSVRS